MSKKNFFSIAVILFLMRILAGHLVSVIFLTDATFDDALMIRYADFHEHFIEQTMPYQNLLIKDMGFPLFLKILHDTGICIIDAISFMWLLSAVTFTILFSTLTDIRRKEILLFVYAFVLFTPVAFVPYLGTRLYRNAAMIPFYFVVITLMTQLFVIYWKKLALTLRQLILFNVTLGILFSWLYYMKEDGLWLLMCLIAVTILCLVKIFFFNTESVKEKLRNTVILILPFVIFGVSTFTYKSVNEHFFGVAIINNRTEGELGQFVKYVYKIKSEERTCDFWAATDAVLKAFDTSETLKQNPELKNAVLHEKIWLNGNIFENPIYGDFLGWVMIVSLPSTCSSPVEQEDFLHKVNTELKAAFDNGTLEKDDRFQLVSSMGGFTFDEILHLPQDMLTIYKYYVATAVPTKLVVTEDRLEFPDNGLSVEENLLRYDDIIDRACDFMNINLRAKNNYVVEANIFLEIIFKVYGALNLIMLIAAIIGIIKKIFFADKNFNDLMIILIAVGALILSIIYAFSISWFCHFLKGESHLYSLYFYSVGIVPMIAIFEIFGMHLFLSSIKKFKSLTLN